MAKLVFLNSIVLGAISDKKNINLANYKKQAKEENHLKVDADGGVGRGGGHAAVQRLLDERGLAHAVVTDEDDFECLPRGRPRAWPT